MSNETIRSRQRMRRAEGIERELKRLNWERSLIQEEYRRVSEVYARHLERLGRRAASNRQEVENIATRMASDPLFQA
jgi:hypothetical protein